MRVHFAIEVEVPDREGLAWIPYVRYMLHNWRQRDFTITRAFPLEDMDPKMAQAIEQEADDRGELPS